MDPLKLLYIIHNPPPQKKKTDRYLIKINGISSNPCISGCDSGVSGHEISGAHGLFFWTVSLHTFGTALDGFGGTSLGRPVSVSYWGRNRRTVWRVENGDTDTCVALYQVGSLQWFSDSHNTVDGTKILQISGVPINWCRISSLNSMSSSIGGGWSNPNVKKIHSSIRDEHLPQMKWE